jgi:small subunit ribosomal protein S20
MAKAHHYTHLAPVARSEMSSRKPQGTVAPAGGCIDNHAPEPENVRLFWGRSLTLMASRSLRLANTKSAEKAARQSTVHRARNDALTSQLRSAIRKATLALKAGKHDDAAAALSAATPIIDSMVNKGIIHRNKAARHKSRLTKQVRALAHK